MMSKEIFNKFLAAICFLLILLSFICPAYSDAQREQSPQDASTQESDQQISDFSLSGFNDLGKKSWDLAGQTADIFENVVKLKDVKGNLYGESENIKLSANKGDFDKKEGKVHLQQDVVITTSSGARLTTDSLDWDRKNQIVNTKERVNIERDNLTATASGATGRPNLNKVNLEKDVVVEIAAAKLDEAKNKDAKSKTVITCDGPLEIDYEKNIATFKNNVKVDNQDALIYSDIMDVYFAKAQKNASSAVEEKEKEKEKNLPAMNPSMNSKIEKLVARGNVKIIKGENISYSDEAVYLASDKKIILTGRPKLILSSTDDLKGVFTAGK